MRPAATLPLLACCTLLAGCLSTPERPAPVVSITTPPLPTLAPPTQADLAPGGGIVKTALALRGTPYRYGGSRPETGFDCSGFVRYVYHQQGVTLPRMAASMAAALPTVDDGSLRVGDLVFFNTRGHRYSHVGIYIGEGRFVHAPSKRTGQVIVSAMKNPYWRKRFTGVRRPLVGQAV